MYHWVPVIEFLMLVQDSKIKGPNVRQLKKIGTYIQVGSVKYVSAVDYLKAVLLEPIR